MDFGWRFLAICNGHSVSILSGQDLLDNTSNLRKRHVAVAVQNVVRAKRDHVSAGQHVVDTALHQTPYIEVKGIEEGRDRNAEHVGRRQILRQRARKKFS
jgi:hypothetical protein